MCGIFHVKFCLTPFRTDVFLAKNFLSSAMAGTAMRSAKQYWYFYLFVGMFGIPLLMILGHYTGLEREYSALLLLSLFHLLLTTALNIY